MEFFFLILTAGVVGWLLWQLTEGSRDPRWREAVEPVDVDLRSLPATPDERTHPVVAAALLVLSVLIVAFAIAAGVFFAGRFVIDRVSQMLGF